MREPETSLAPRLHEPYRGRILIRKRVVGWFVRIALLAGCLAAVGMAAPLVSGSEGVILFYSDRDGNAEIYAMNPDGSSVTRVTSNPAHDWMPAWSPGGEEILFSSDRDGRGLDLYAASLDGKTVRRRALRPPPSHRSPAEGLRAPNRFRGPQQEVTAGGLVRSSPPISPGQSDLL